jgi:hypothetical protein
MLDWARGVWGWTGEFDPEAVRKRFEPGLGKQRRRDSRSTTDYRATSRMTQRRLVAAWNCSYTWRRMGRSSREQMVPLETDWSTSRAWDGLPSNVNHSAATIQNVV